MTYSTVLTFILSIYSTVCITGIHSSRIYPATFLEITQQPEKNLTFPGKKQSTQNKKSDIKFGSIFTSCVYTSRIGFWAQPRNRGMAHLEESDKCTTDDAGIKQWLRGDTLHLSETPRIPQQQRYTSPNVGNEDTNASFKNGYVIK